MAFMMDKQRNVRYEVTPNNKRACRVATIDNITNLNDVSISSTAFDGVTITSKDRILVLHQTDRSKNGIYVAGPVRNDHVALIRAPDANASNLVTSGMLVSVNEGEENGNKLYMLVTDGVIQLDKTEQEFVYFEGKPAELSEEEANELTNVLVRNPNIDSDNIITPQDATRHLTLVGSEGTTSYFIVLDSLEEQTLFEITTSKITFGVNVESNNRIDAPNIVYQPGDYSSRIEQRDGSIYLITKLIDESEYEVELSYVTGTGPIPEFLGIETDFYPNTSAGIPQIDGATAWYSLNSQFEPGGVENWSTIDGAIVFTSFEEDHTVALFDLSNITSSQLENGYTMTMKHGAITESVSVIIGSSPGLGIITVLTLLPTGTIMLADMMESYTQTGAYTPVVGADIRIEVTATVDNEYVKVYYGEALIIDDAYTGGTLNGLTFGFMAPDNNTGESIAGPFKIEVNE